MSSYFKAIAKLDYNLVFLVCRHIIINPEKLATAGVPERLAAAAIPQIHGAI